MSIYKKKLLDYFRTLLFYHFIYLIFRRIRKTEKSDH